MGLRPAEVCGLRWPDIDLDAKTLKVANTRTLTWGDEGCRVVEKAPKPKGRQTCRPDWLRRRAYELMAAARMRRVRLYDARHASLTHLRMSGVPGPIVSAWAGHADLTTDRNYVHRPI